MNILKRTYYSLLNAVTFGKGVPRTINGLTVRFPARWSRYYPADYEKENYAFLKQQVKPGMHIIDIGAHIGLFSASASQLTGPTGKVVCFEPTPGTYAVLTETLRLNHCTNVTPVQAAVSHTPGEAVFYIGDAEGCNSNSLVKNKSEEELTAYPVKLVDIDSVVATYQLRPSLIKIDAEGAELDVLRGGLQTYKNFKPILILGLHPDFVKKKGDTMEQIWDVVEGAGYKVNMDGKPISKDAFCNHADLFEVHCL